MAPQKPKRGVYIVQEDLDYFRSKFKPGEAGGPPRIGQEMLEEFLEYSDFVEKHYNYSFVFKAFAPVFATRRLAQDEQ